MKITEELLILPPYLLTSWDQITSIRMEEETLVVSLKNSQEITIPELHESVIQHIFSMYASYLEKKREAPEPFAWMQAVPDLTQLTATIQHNPAMSGAPDMPEELLGRIRSVVQMMGEEALETITDAEPHCNCPHCQVARALHRPFPEQIEESEGQPVQDEDLTFQQWEIAQIGDKLFSVTNKIVPDEQYQVHLGEPVGCTCGQKGCEHLLVVLRS